jgi:hypothetical protein
MPVEVNVLTVAGAVEEAPIVVPSILPPSMLTLASKSFVGVFPRNGILLSSFK